MRETPDIFVDTKLKFRDRRGFNNFVLQVIEETFIYQFSPTSIEVITVDGEDIFKLFLVNKRFIIDILLVDDIKDYIDIYLYGVKQPENRYDVEVDGNTIIVTFNRQITRLPSEVDAGDFIVKGKITEI
jgi:hypothetical protein